MLWENGGHDFLRYLIKNLNVILVNVLQVSIIIAFVPKRI